MPTVRVAVFDLGSSSFHLMVVDASRDGHLTPVLRRRSFLHLGTEVARTGGVPADRAASAVRAVRRLRVAADDAGVDVVVALATAALRDAANGTKLIGRLELVLGCSITLLTGEEEARLCFLGQRAGVWVGRDPVLGLDLGGGSLEAGIGTIDEVSDVASVALGTARLRGELGTGELLTPADRVAVTEVTLARSHPIAAMLERHPDAGAQGHRQWRYDPGAGPAGRRAAPAPRTPRVLLLGPGQPSRTPGRSDSTNWPTAWPRWTSTPGWPCPASTPSGHRCCPSGRWCSPPWSSTWASSAWW